MGNPPPTPSNIQQFNPNDIPRHREGFDVEGYPGEPYIGEASVPGFVGGFK